MLLGRGDRTRTCGVLLPKQARYQLRHTSLYSFFLGSTLRALPFAVPCIDFACRSPIADRGTTLRVHSILHRRRSHSIPTAPHLVILPIDYNLLKMKKQVYFLSSYNQSNTQYCHLTFSLFIIPYYLKKAPRRVLSLISQIACKRKAYFKVSVKCS